MSHPGPIDSLYAEQSHHRPEESLAQTQFILEGAPSRFFSLNLTGKRNEDFCPS